ncbi:hypothetical protein I7I48_00180 [Histoplasma ohiense]|nr:hypothetical protein I7I48_00180 [Histoplasma ohiense (nom. inval.)]
MTAVSRGPGRVAHQAGVGHTPIHAYSLLVMLIAIHCALNPPWGEGEECELDAHAWKIAP